MQLTPAGKRNIAIAVVVVVVLNALVTLSLLKTVSSQNNRIQTLERNDKITQSVKSLDSKVNNLKQRVEGLFH